VNYIIFVHSATMNLIDHGKTVFTQFNRRLFSKLINKKLTFILTMLLHYYYMLHTGILTLYSVYNSIYYNAMLLLHVNLVEVTVGETCEVELS